MGFAFPHDDINKPYRFCAGPSNSRHLPPLAFLTPPTVCSTTCRASLFHPAAVSRIHSSRVVPSRIAAMSRRHRLSCLLDDSSELATHGLTRECHAPGRHPQGFVPCESPSEKRRGLAFALPRSLLEFSLLQVLLSLPSPQSLTPASTHRLIARLSGHPNDRRTAC